MPVTEETKITRKNGYCASKHPKSPLLRCWLPKNHEGKYCNAGLEDWETPRRYRLKKKVS